MSALPNSVPSSRKAQRQSALATQRAQRLSGIKAAKPSSSFKAASAVRPASAKLWESGMVIGVNTVLISTAIVTLAHLVPHQLTQHAKLKQIRTEESSLAQNIQTLQQNYEQNMSPEAAQRVAQQQGNLMPADQVSVVLTHPSAKAQ
jgi:cell division protein ZapA (FtsZ GTPase activity inhibitor)